MAAGKVCCRVWNHFDVSRRFFARTDQKFRRRERDIYNSWCFWVSSPSLAFAKLQVLRNATMAQIGRYSAYEDSLCCTCERTRTHSFVFTFYWPPGVSHCHHHLKEYSTAVVQQCIRHKKRSGDFFLHQARRSLQVHRATYLSNHPLLYLLRGHHWTYSGSTGESQCITAEFSFAGMYFFFSNTSSVKQSKVRHDSVERTPRQHKRKERQAVLGPRILPSVPNPTTHLSNTRI